MTGPEFISKKLDVWEYYYGVKLDLKAQAAVEGAFISLTKLQFNWSSIVFGVLLFVLFVDLLFAHKFNVTRLTGKNMAHIIFILAIIIGLLIIKNGSII